MTAGGGRAARARLVAAFVVDAVRDDPAWFVVQAVRKAPQRVRTTAVRALGAVPSPAARALAGLLSGDDDAAAAAARAALGDGARRGRPSRTAADVAVAVGRPDLVGPDAPPTARARAAWALGDVVGVETAAAPGAGRAAVALRSEVAALRAAAAVAPAADAPTGTTTDGARSTTTVATGTTAAPRVLHHLTNSLPHTQSGYTLRSHAVLRAQQAAGLEVTATTRAAYPLTVGALGAREADVVDGVTYRRLLPRTLPADRRARLAQGVDLLVAVGRETGADVVHSTTPHTTGAVARDAAQRLGVPWVHEVRGLPEETWVAAQRTPDLRERAAASARYRLVRDAETALAAAADRVVTLSATMRDELVGRGVDPERVTVVPNAVDAALLDGEHPDAPTARERLGLPVAPWTVGTVSSLVDYEGLDTVVRVVAALRAAGQDVQGLVVGDGVSRPALRRLAAALGVAEHVHLPGRVPRDAARTALAALDVVLVPRRPDRVTRLVTPLKPVEAMALGRPVVASALPALAEVVGGAGVLVAPDDLDAWGRAVLDLRDDAGEYAAVVERGRAVARQRTWSAQGERYRSLVETCRGGTR